MSKQANEKGKLWVSKETRPYRASILFLTCLSVFAMLFSLAFAYTVRYLINSASNKESAGLWIFSALLLSFLLLKILLNTLKGYFSERVNARMTANLRTRIFSKILHSNYPSTQKYHSGELVTRLTTDIAEVASYSVNLLPAIAGMLIQGLGSIAALMTIDPLFTLIYILAGGVFGGLTALFRKHLKKRHKEVMEADGKFRAYMQEGLSSLMTVKAYGAENRSTEKAENFAEEYYQKRMRRNILRTSMSGVFNLVSNFGLIFAIIWCGVCVLNDNPNYDFGTILSVILLLMQLQAPLTSFSSIPPAYYARIACGERLADIDDMPLEQTDEAEISNDLYDNLQSIVFENLGFTYGRNQIFQDANATVKKGEIICLTGPSGAGKSTIFKLLLNVFEPTQGNIILQGNFDEKRILTAQDRGLFAYVPQGNFLFSGTIYENLAFFTKKEDDSILREKMREALKIACAEFVFELPQGLETVLTERGGGLSEGQLQRLAVARALLSNRPILLLDEATSALDGDTERQLLENISALKNKTCLIVTHRPKALEIADGILHIENGKIL
ncbi:MAG: ABC transporter ATP-binding protein [Clostridiales bacterium]|nr:ABC transporter ATP-binding protein [Clostridiales bacterium]